MVRPKIGVELIVWGKGGKIFPDSGELPGVLDEVSSLGYVGVETIIVAFEKVPDPKYMLSKKGLSLAGLHMLLEGLREKQANAALDFLRKADSHYLLFSFAGGKDNSEENYQKNAKLLEKIGKKAADQGAKVCYHNHWQEIVNDALGMKIICSRTSPEHVSLAVDTYWVQSGGLSPAEYIKENLDRVEYLHLKDGTEKEMKSNTFPSAELGKGIVDFRAILETAKSKDIEWYVVEQDHTNRTPMESMAISRRFLKEKFGL